MVVTTVIIRAMSRHTESDFGRPPIDTVLADLELAGQILQRSGIKSEFPLLYSEGIQTTHLSETLMQGRGSIHKTVEGLLLGTQAAWRKSLLRRVIQPEDWKLHGMPPAKLRAEALYREHSLEHRGIHPVNAAREYHAHFFRGRAVILGLPTNIPNVKYKFKAVINPPYERISVEENLYTANLDNL